MIRRLVLLMAILWIAGFAQAKNLHWKDLPAYVKGSPITVESGRGGHYLGDFVSTSADFLVMNTAGGELVFPRQDILSITRHAIRRSRVSALGDLQYVAAAPSPLIIVAVPVAIAIVLVGLPVCALLDVVDRRGKDVTIKILPDPK